MTGDRGAAPPFAASPWGPVLKEYVSQVRAAAGPVGSGAAPEKALRKE
jgi:hypothetical protein